MRVYLFLLFLFIGHCACVEYEDYVEDWARKIQKSQDSEDSNIVYPCSRSDMNCIRKFFSTHGDCKPVYGPIPDPLIIDRMLLPMATSNISFILENVKIRGLNGKITSFYFNKKTENLVIAFEAKPLSIITPRVTFKYNRKGKEPISLTDTFFISYTAATFTATIPSIKKLQLAEADVYAYLSDNDPHYGFGPGVMNSYDPVVLKGFNHLILNIPENSKESLVIQAPNFMNIFIQHNICDFGLKLEI